MIQFDEPIVQMGLVQLPTRKVLLILLRKTMVVVLVVFFSFCFDRDTPNSIRYEMRVQLLCGEVL